MVVLLCGQGFVYSLHSGLVTSREDTRNIARKWMVLNVPAGKKIVVEPVVPDQWAQDVGNPSPLVPNGNRWSKYPLSRSQIDPKTGRSLPPPGVVVNIEDFERVLRPELVTFFEQQEYCWVVVGSTQRGRAEVEPDEVPLALAYYEELERRSTVAYEVSPYAKGKGPGEVQLRLDVQLLPARLQPPRAGHHDLPTARRQVRGGLGSAGLRIGLCCVSGPSPNVRALVSTLTAVDQDHLARSIELAENGLGRVHPNPMVGALIVRDGKVLGEGWHEECGGPHAEVNALADVAAAGATTEGATLYVSMEPCCHHGKTPPCTDAILAAGIARVVVASDDPSTKASGRGLGILRDEGVEVDVADGEHRRRARGSSTRPSASTLAPAGRGCSSSRR